MNVLARELIENIPGMAEGEIDSVRVLVSGRMAESFREHLGASPERINFYSLVFESFRSLDQKHSRSSHGTKELILRKFEDALIDDLRMRFQDIDRQTLMAYVQKAWPEYFQMRRQLFAARTRSSQVGAVLRPFHQRWFEPWRRLRTDEDFEQFESLRAELASQTINNLTELRTWSERVWDFFTSIAVYSEPDSEKRPSGMISEGSLRTYSLHWKNWMKHHEQMLLNRDFLPSVDERVLGFRKFRTIAQPLKLEQLSPLGSAHGQAVSNTSETKLSIDVSRSGGSFIKVGRKWVHVPASLKPDLIEWIGKLGDLLGAQELDLDVSVEIRQNSGPVTANFKAKDAEELAQKTEALLKALA